MARKQGSGFKMKSSPAKGILSDFFQGINAKKTDMNELRAKQRRSSKGISEFEYRKTNPRVKKAKPYDIKSSSIFEPTKFGHEGKSFFSPTASDLDRKLMMQDKKLDLKKTKNGLYDPSKTTKQTFKQAFASAKQAGKETFEWKGNPYTTELKEKKVKKTKVNTDPVIDIDQDNIPDFEQGTTSYHTTDPSETYKDFVPNKPKTSKKVVVEEAVEKKLRFPELGKWHHLNAPTRKKSPTKKSGFKMKKSSAKNYGKNK